MPGAGGSGQAEVLAGALPAIDGNVGIAQSCLQLEELHPNQSKQSVRVEILVHDTACSAFWRSEPRTRLVGTWRSAGTAVKYYLYYVACMLVGN